VPQNLNEKKILKSIKEIWQRCRAAKESIGSPFKQANKVLLHKQLGLSIPEDKENQRPNKLITRVDLQTQLLGRFDSQLTHCDDEITLQTRDQDMRC